MPYSPKSAHQTGDMKRLWRNSFPYSSILISVKTPGSHLGFQSWQTITDLIISKFFPGP